MSQLQEEIWVFINKHGNGVFIDYCADKQLNQSTKYIRADIHTQQDVQGLVDAANYYLKDLEPWQYQVHGRDGGFLLDLYDFLGKLREALKSYQEGRG